MVTGDWMPPASSCTDISWAGPLGESGRTRQEQTPVCFDCSQPSQAALPPPPGDLTGVLVPCRPQPPLENPKPMEIRAERWPALLAVINKAGAAVDIQVRDTALLSSAHSQVQRQTQRSD